MTDAVFKDKLGALKSNLKVLNNHLNGKHFLVGESLTIADVGIACALSYFMGTVLGAGERKAFVNVVNWFERCTSLPSFIRRMGYVKMTEKAFRPFDKNAKVEPVKAAPVKKAVEEVDEDDLFGSDGEDDAEAAEAAKKAAAAAKDSKKKVKKPVIAMSLVMLEVKPVDDTTNLDTLAAHLFKNIT